MTETKRKIYILAVWMCLMLIGGQSCLAAGAPVVNNKLKTQPKTQAQTQTKTPAKTQTQPKTAAPDSTPAPVPVQKPAATPAPTPAPPTLTVDDAVKLALDNNLQVKMAERQVNAANDKIEQAKAGYRPNVGFSAMASHLNEPPDIVKLAEKLSDLNNGLRSLFSYLTSSAYGPYYQGYLSKTEDTSVDTGLNYYTLALSITQPIYTGGKLTALNKQAQANKQQALEELENQKQTLVLNVKSAYYTILQAQRIEQTLTEAVADMQNHINEANIAYKAGVVAKLDVVQAEVKLADLQQKLITARNGVALAKKAFNFVLGIGLDKEYTLVENLKKDPFPKDMETCKTLALANRPEIRSLKQKEEMARQQVAVVKSVGKPLVAFVVNAEQQDTKIANAQSYLNFNLVAQYKLYDGGLVKNQIAEAEDNLKTVQTAEDLLNQGVMLEVEQAYRNLQNALESIEVANKSLASAQETLKMAQVSYKAGLCTSLERIDAEVGMTQAENNYTAALAAYNIALARLEKSIGKNKEELQ